jgi:hypothetical protein
MMPSTAPPSSAEDPRPTDPSPTVRLLLAACSFGAACIHLAMVPSHAAEWYAEGIAFAVAGWVQLLLAVAFLARPSKVVLAAACAADAVFVGAWVWTRTVGPPWGPEAGVAHEVGFVDVTAVYLEAATIGIAVLAWVRPTIGSTLRRAWAVPGAAVAAAIVVLSTVAIASPSASGHSHSEVAGEGHAHGAAEDASDHHADDATLVTDGHVDGHAPTDAAAVDDLGLAALHNGDMSHEYGPDQPLDATTRAALVHQLALTRLVAQLYPTLGDARAAGSQPAGAFNPGMGIHMSLPSVPDLPPPDPAAPHIEGTLSDAEVLRPANLLYAGSTDDAPLAGLMYYSASEAEPAGFAGPNDHWHTHGNLCLDMNDPSGRIGVLNTADDTAAACEDVGGFYYEQTQWMVHVWTIPGYESNRGVFSDINPSIACPDGTYHVVEEELTDRYQLDHCRSNPA